ncbi:polysaccharide deacetylase family protein [Microtetraspora fusca]|uniref:Polysaccharide deacetylase family protein n=1 Tax=Microtetraspora fusca TaxID=1997 RepID=A0ABW6VEH7_MICFU
MTDAPRSGRTMPIMLWRRSLLLSVLLVSGCAGHAPTGVAPRTAADVGTEPRPAAAAPNAPEPSPEASGIRRPRDPIHHGPRKSDMVALTFDADMTSYMEGQLDRGEVDSYANPRLIAELRRLKVPATIFMTGLWIKRYPDVAAGLAADPLFELADHSYDHKAFSTPCYGLGRTDDMRGSLRRTEALLDRLAPAHPRFFRFPGGCFDKAALRAVAAEVLTPIQWDVVGGDAFATSKDVIVRQTLGGVRGGSIVVLHLGGGKPSGLTDDALPAIVKGIRERGLRPVTLSTLLGHR